MEGNFEKIVLKLATVAITVNITEEAERKKNMWIREWIARRNFRKCRHFFD